MQTVYVLTLADGALYVGRTQDLVKRLKAHNLPLTKAKILSGAQLYVKAHGGVKSVTVIAEDIETIEEATCIEERTAANLKKLGRTVTCHPWRDPITGLKSKHAQAYDAR